MGKVAVENECCRFKHLFDKKKSKVKKPKKKPKKDSCGRPIIKEPVNNREECPPKLEKLEACCGISKKSRRIKKPSRVYCFDNLILDGIKPSLFDRQKYYDARHILCVLEAFEIFELIKIKEIRKLLKENEAPFEKDKELLDADDEKEECDEESAHSSKKKKKNKDRKKAAKNKKSECEYDDRISICSFDSDIDLDAFGLTKEDVPEEKPHPCPQDETLSYATSVPPDSKPSKSTIPSEKIASENISETIVSEAMPSDNVEPEEEEEE